MGISGHSSALDDRLIKLATTTNIVHNKSILTRHPLSSTVSHMLITLTELVISLNSPPPPLCPIPVLIVQAITTRQSNQSNDNQTTTTPHHSSAEEDAAAHHPTSSAGQFKTITTNGTKFSDYYVLDEGKNFTNGCPVTDSSMVSFWFRVDDQGGRTISWEHQVS